MSSEAAVQKAVAGWQLRASRLSEEHLGRGVPSAVRQLTATSEALAHERGLVWDERAWGGAGGEPHDAWIHGWQCPPAEASAEQLVGAGVTRPGEGSHALATACGGSSSHHQGSGHHQQQLMPSFRAPGTAAGLLLRKMLQARLWSSERMSVELTQLRAAAAAEGGLLDQCGGPGTSWCHCRKGWGWRKGGLSPAHGGSSSFGS